MKPFIGWLVLAALAPLALVAQQADILSEPQRKALVDQRDRLWNEAKALRDKDDLTAALAKAEETLALERRLFGDTHEEIAGTLQWIAEVFEDRDDLSAAIRRREDVLRILTSVHGHDDWRVVDARLSLAHVHKIAALSSEERQQIAHAEAQSAHADELFDKGQVRDAIPFDEEGVNIRRKILGDEDPDTVRCLGNLAFLYKTMGEYGRAETLYQQALAVRRKILGQWHPDTALTLNNLGGLYHALGDYLRAESFYQEALTIRRKVLDENDPDIGQSLNNLAGIYSALSGFGETARAEPLYQEALALFRRTSGEEHPNTSALLNNLGSFYISIGDYARAEPMMKQALALRRKVLGEEHPLTALTMRNLASLYALLGDYPRAEALFKQALTIYRKTVGEDQPDTAGTLQNLGRLYVMLGDVGRAEPLYLQALAIRRKVLGERHSDTAWSLSNLGALYKSRGDYAQAEPLFQQALTIRQQVLGSEHPYTALSLNELGDLYAALGDDARAEPYYQQSLAITLEHLKLTSVVQSERQQLAMARQARQHLDSYVAFVARTHRSEGLAWEHIVAWKGAVLARRRAERAIGDDPNVRGLFVELQSAASQLAVLAFGAPDPDKTELWRRQVTELSERKERLEVELARKSAGFQQAMEDSTGEAVRHALPEDTVLIDILQYDLSATPSIERSAPGATIKNPTGPQDGPRLVAFVVRAKGAVRTIDLGAAAPIADAIAAWRQGFGNTEQAERAGRTLRSTVWEPIEAAFDGPRPKQVLLSPDGALSQFPFAALPGRRTGTYLLEEWPIATVPAAQMLPALLAARARPEGRMLVLGDVNYDRRDMGPATPRASPSHRAPRDDSTRFEPLAGTRGELATIERLYREAFGDAGIRTLSGPLATEDAVRREAARYRYLHLATHGFFAAERFRSALQRSTQPGTGSMELRGNQSIAGYHPGLLAGLVLAGANAPMPDDDGILTAEEVATLNLSRVELAVLSACETGLGQIAGGEGLLGLQRAFHAAGARTVIASLWKVDDTATREIMERFYENLWTKNLDKLAALRDAQLWMLRVRGARGLPVDARGLKVAGVKRPDVRLAPYYWAAFVLSGDWR